MECLLCGATTPPSSDYGVNIHLIVTSCKNVLIMNLFLQKIDVFMTSLPIFALQHKK